MAHSLSMEITHAISYITSLEHSLNQALHLLEDAFEYARDLDEDDSNYNDKLRKKIKDLNEDLDQDHDLDYKERDLFLSDLEDIEKNKDDERVIYSLRNFVHKEEDLKDFKKKKMERFLDRVRSEKRVTKRSEEMVLYVAYSRIETLTETLLNFLDSVIKKVNKLTKLKNEEDDDNIFIKKLDSLTKPREKNEGNHD